MSCQAVAGARWPVALAIMRAVAALAICAGALVKLSEGDYVTFVYPRRHGCGHRVERLAAGDSAKGASLSFPGARVVSSEPPMVASTKVTLEITWTTARPVKRFGSAWRRRHAPIGQFCAAPGPRPRPPGDTEQSRRCAGQSGCLITGHHSRVSFVKGMRGLPGAGVPEERLWRVKAVWL